MAVGEVVEVSGPTNFDGSLQATFIEKKAGDLAAFPATDDLEIQGVVTGLTATAFLINGLTIDFSGATVRDGTLANGVLVEVKGNALAVNTLTATDVEIKRAGMGVDDIDEAEVEGVVNNLDTATINDNDFKDDDTVIGRTAFLTGWRRVTCSRHVFAAAPGIRLNSKISTGRITGLTSKFLAAHRAAIFNA